MRYRLSLKEREWLCEEIEKTSRTTPEERLRYLSSLQRLYRTALKRRRTRGVELHELERAAAVSLKE